MPMDLVGRGLEGGELPDSSFFGLPPYLRVPKLSWYDGLCLQFMRSTTADPPSSITSPDSTTHSLPSPLFSTYYHIPSVLLCLFMQSTSFS